MSSGAGSGEDARELEVVAIDGPSGAGKSTIAKRLAARLGWRHLDTGAMYRAVTWFFLASGIDTADTDQVAAALADLELRLGEHGRVWIGEREVTDRLRLLEVEGLVSTISAIPIVRRAMRRIQRSQARGGKLVAEGRDMTSVVFTDARWKFYVDADPEERARRRQQDFRDRGREVPLEAVRKEIEERDRIDSTRSESPLKKIPQAEWIDTTTLTIDEVVELLASRVKKSADD